MISTIERGIGGWLRRVRAGDRFLAWNAPGIAEAPDSIRLVSPAFADGAPIPSRHAGSGIGDNISPQLAWSNLPVEAVELVLIMQDPDAPLPRPVVHLIATAIAPDRRDIEVGGLSPEKAQAIRFGRGLFGRIGYVGPRPLRGHRPHRYIFQIFALSERLALPDRPAIDAVVSGMRKSLLTKGRLTGLYERT